LGLDTTNDHALDVRHDPRRLIDHTHLRLMSPCGLPVRGLALAPRRLAEVYERIHGIADLALDLDALAYEQTDIDPRGIPKAARGDLRDRFARCSALRATR